MNDALQAKIEAKMNRLMDTYERVKDDYSSYASIKLRHDVAFQLVMMEFLLGMEKSNELRKAKGWKEFDEKTWKKFVLDRVIE